MKFNLSISQSEIKQAKSKVLQHQAQKMSLKGFRKGKAPLNLIEEQLDPTQLKQAIFEETLPSLLTDYLKSHNLKPICDPEISDLSTPENADWTVAVEIAEAPSVELKDYQQVLIKLKKEDKLFHSPKKTSENAKSSNSEVAPDKSKAATEVKNKQLNKMLDTLIQYVQLEIPSLLIKQDVNNRLSRLANQIGQLGLNVEDYLKAQNLSAEQLKSQYETESIRAYQVEYILQAIAKDLKITISDAQLEQQAATIEDDKVKHAIEHHPEEKEYYRSLLVREKTVQSLLDM